MAGQQGFLGIVMLDTRFPRPPGDVGHPDTFGVPIRRMTVEGAWPQRIVASAQSLRAANVAPAFVRAMRELESEGARAITTSCGFLVLLQAELQAAVSVPVVSSSLLQLPGLLRQEQQVGVLTISAELLGEEHLRAAGVEAGRIGDVVVQGVRTDSEFAGAILGNRGHMDLVRAERDVVEAALALKARATFLKTVVLECTNMPPYAQAIRDATGLEVRSLIDDPTLRKELSF
jgi:Asp/Glu/Hydantoin racemase